MTSATEVRPTTCPSWCTRDHKAAEEQIRAIVQSVADLGYSDYPAAVLDEEIVASRRDHERDFSEGAVTVSVSSSGGEEPLVLLHLDRSADLNAGQARKVAAALLAASDKLDEIEAEASA